MNITKPGRLTCDDPPEAMAPNRFTSSRPLTSSSEGSLSSSGPLVGVSGDMGSEGSLPAAVINSASRCLGPVNEIGFSRKVVDTVRQRRGSSKCIRTKATIGFRLCGLDETYYQEGRTDVHYEFEYCDPGFPLWQPE